MRVLCVCAVVLCAGLGLPVVLGSAVSRQEVPPSDLLARVVALEKLSGEQQKRIAVLEETLGKVHLRTEGHETWIRSVPEAVELLAAGVADAEALGFTKAGANVDAREALLRGLRGFGDAIKAGPRTTTSLPK